MTTRKLALDEMEEILDAEDSDEEDEEIAALLEAIVKEGTPQLAAAALHLRSRMKKAVLYVLDDDEGAAELEVDEEGAVAYEDACFPSSSLVAELHTSLVAEVQSSGSKVKPAKSASSIVKSSISKAFGSSAAKPFPRRLRRVGSDTGTASEFFHEPDGEITDSRSVWASRLSTALPQGLVMCLSRRPITTRSGCVKFVSALPP